MWGAAVRIGVVPQELPIPEGGVLMGQSLSEELESTLEDRQVSGILRTLPTLVSDDEAIVRVQQVHDQIHAAAIWRDEEDSPAQGLWVPVVEHRSMLRLGESELDEDPDVPRLRVLTMVRDEAGDRLAHAEEPSRPTIRSQ